MNNSSNFLVLGHRGFLGKQLVSHFQNRGLELRTIDSYLTLSNSELILERAIDENTIVVNCIAKGVTQKSDSYVDNLDVNANLLKSILNMFIQTKGQKFIHFASNYELDGRFFIPDSRRNYVDSKKLGSAICNEFIKLDPRVNLIYLPTLIAETLPRGRFVADFMDAQKRAIEFEINYPNSALEILTVSRLINYFEHQYTFNPGGQVGFAPIEMRIRVFQLASLMNQILHDLGIAKVSIRYPHSFNAADSKSDIENFDPVFFETVKTYLLTMMEETL
jgi:nucleoside-diphosphate-sugar epimerase